MKANFNCKVKKSAHRRKRASLFSAQGINIASLWAGFCMSPSVMPGNNAFRISCIIQRAQQALGSAIIYLNLSTGMSHWKCILTTTCPAYKRERAAEKRQGTAQCERSRKTKRGESVGVMERLLLGWESGGWEIEVTACKARRYGRQSLINGGRLRDDRERY